MSGVESLFVWVLGSSVSSTSRPALTFFVVQVAIGIAVTTHMLAINPACAWLISWVAIGVGFGAVLVEYLIQHSEDFEQILRDLKVQHSMSALSSFTMALILMSLGFDGAGSAALEDGMAANETINAVRLAAEADAPLWLKFVALAVGLGANIFLSFIREKVLEMISDVGAHGLWQKFESGGVVAFMLFVIFAPAIGLILLIVFTVLMGLVAGIGTLVARSRDQKLRRPCTNPDCDYRPRSEALICPRCRATQTPSLWLLPKDMRGQAQPYCPAGGPPAGAWPPGQPVPSGQQPWPPQYGPPRQGWPQPSGGPAPYAPAPGQPYGAGYAPAPGQPAPYSPAGQPYVAGYAYGQPPPRSGSGGVVLVVVGLLVLLLVVVPSILAAGFFVLVALD